MPHGAGHAGGHHHHGGGGIHHHHHHRGFHHHHVHYGSTYGFGPHYRYGYRRRSLGWGFFALTIFGVCVTLAVIFSVRYGISDDNSSSSDFSSNETRALSFSYIFCDSLSVFTVDLDIFAESGELYVLSQEPSLTDRDSFKFQIQPYFTLNSQNYHNWNYYLYKGSTYKFSACKKNSLSNFKYYIIKGSGKFNDWVDDPYAGSAMYSGSIATCSSTGGSRTNYTLNVKTEGEYYIVFYLKSGTTSDTIDVEFDVHRTKYAVDPSTIISNCSLGISGCAVDIPLSYSFALVALKWDPTYNANWSKAIDMDSYCSARIWLYVVISLACVGIFAVVIVGITVCCCCLFYRNKKKYTPLRGDNTPAPLVNEGPAPTTATYVTATDAPPPFTPSYGAPPKYSN